MHVETKFWIHPDGWIYVGDEMEGAREATKEEIDDHISKINQPDVTDE
ncbi:Uncharacterised protein [Yersinia enterocolitica]|nr:hypothetical protein [Yersinia enterocolitica]CRY06367.1 Uncharacterised protein [Yersinia enterocolitica]